MARHKVHGDYRAPGGGRREERTFTDTWWWDDATDTITVEEIESIETVPHRGQVEEHVQARCVREVAWADAPQDVRDEIERLRL